MGGNRVLYLAIGGPCRRADLHRHIELDRVERGRKRVESDDTAPEVAGLHVKSGDLGQGVTVLPLSIRNAFGDMGDSVTVSPPSICNALGDTCGFGDAGGVMRSNCGEIVPEMAIGEVGEWVGRMWTDETTPLAVRLVYDMVYRTMPDLTIPWARVAGVLLSEPNDTDLWVESDAEVVDWLLGHCGEGRYVYCYVR